MLLEKDVVVEFLGERKCKAAGKTGFRPVGATPRLLPVGLEAGRKPDRKAKTPPEDGSAFG